MSDEFPFQLRDNRGEPMNRPFAGITHPDAPGLCFTSTKERQRWELLRTRYQKRGKNQ